VRDPAAAVKAVDPGRAVEPGRTAERAKARAGPPAGTRALDKAAGKVAVTKHAQRPAHAPALSAERRSPTAGVFPARTRNVPIAM
jgi:hypothetical protein